MKQKYSKWVVGAASAALVASAIVPAASAASFSDIKDNDHEDAILALADAKIVAGYPDGTFRPDAVVTRGNVTKFLGKWLVSENYEIPADYATKARFTDLPTSTSDKELLQYAALVKDAGVFKGSNNQLMQANNMSREQMAVVLVRAIKTVYNIDLVADYKDADFESVITDLDKATATENREAIIALEYAGITNVKTIQQFNPKNSVTRGQFASFLHRTITMGEQASLTVKEVKVVDATTLEVTLSDDKKHTVTLPTPLPENKETKVEFVIDGKTYSAEVTYVTAVKVKSVDAVNAKTLAVTFNKPVETEKAKFELKKDGFKSNFSSITWNEDKTVATIELTSKITKGEFTVNVTGLTDEALTGSVKTEDEKVSSIEILGEVAPLIDNTNTATIGYQIKNQYGEDITKLNASSLTVSAAGAKADPNANGSITITKDGLKEGDKVVLTVIHGATATTTTQTVTVSAKTVASDVTIGALYNKDGKTLTEDTALAKDKFYLPVTVKDQYGKEITELKRLKDEVLVTNTNQAVATFGEFEKQTIEGKEVVVLPVDKIVATGDTNVIVIAKATGKNGQATVKVAEGVRADSVTLGAPTKVVTAEADILFPLFVSDKQGNAIKDTTVLNGTKGISITGGSLVEKDGELYAKVAGANVKENTPVTVVVTSSTGKVATQTVIPKSTTAPKVITGLNSKVSTAIREIAGEKVEITAKDIVVEDQFGQVISTDELLAKLATAKYTIEASTDENAPFEVTGKIGAADNKITVAYKAGATKTTANVTFKLVKEDNTAIEASTYSKQFSVVKDSSFTSYKVEDIKPIYVTEKEAGKADLVIPDKYGKDIVVKAVTANGGEVTLKAGSDYTVKSAVLTNVADGNITTDDAAKVEFDKDAKTATAKVTITINATGEEIVKEVTFSKAAPKVEKVAVVEDGKAQQYINGDAVNFVTTSSYNVAADFDLDAFFKLTDVVVTDQYGVMATVAEADATGVVKGQAVFNGVPTAAATLTLSKVSGEVVFSNNGTATASATGKAGDVFNARVNIGGQSATPVKVTAKQDFKN
ncbi:S-layer homology domain-containing protein [Lysinibacillus sphaericus]|uniref:S-layer homology domain-containing protein n=1 Tax=Lysinibacillus sphaericus TaxID=1421 RepID=A0A544UHB3_LYSSH|nr:S-layer homology domain-containing protein [Lysinibacillus sp. SDF0037]TQR32226.1 S-layer homology domain-containing protein [Lysinibacillus sp. SDF0037]